MGCGEVWDVCVVGKCMKGVVVNRLKEGERRRYKEIKEREWTQQEKRFDGDIFL